MNFRTPKELLGDTEEKVPVSARIKKSAAKTLEDAAKKAGVKPSHLYGRILEDYADQLTSPPKRKK